MSSKKDIENITPTNDRKSNNNSFTDMRLLHPGKGKQQEEPVGMFYMMEEENSIPIRGVLTGEKK